MNQQEEQKQVKVLREQAEAGVSAAILVDNPAVARIFERAAASHMANILDTDPGGFPNRRAYEEKVAAKVDRARAIRLIWLGLQSDKERGLEAVLDLKKIEEFAKEMEELNG